LPALAARRYDEAVLRALSLVTVLLLAACGTAHEQPPPDDTDAGRIYIAMSQAAFDCGWQGYPAPESAAGIAGVTCTDVDTWLDKTCAVHTYPACDYKH
jgi:hypothetical protein